MFMINSFLMAGLVCLITALVGGEITAFEIEIPVLESVLRIAVGLVGLAFIGVALLESVSRRTALRLLGFLWLILIAVVISDSVGVQLVLRSNPDHADIFLDWVPKGQTPVLLEGRKIAGLLVVMKDGYQPQFRHINYDESVPFPEIILVPEQPPLRMRLLLLAAEAASGESIDALVNQLGQEGFTTIGDQEVKEFQQALLQAGRLSHPALRAWTRAKLNTDLLVTARVRQSTRKVSEQDFGNKSISKVLQGIEQAEVHMALEVHDMRSGDQVTVVTGKGEAFTLDRAQSIQKALTEAATDVGKKLRLWAHG
jgi:hypothetical protein